MLIQLRYSLVLTLTGLVFAAAGCGDGRPERVPISGQVLLDGQPLTYGYVRFVPEGARASGGGLDENGRFVLGCLRPPMVPSSALIELK